MNMRCSSYLFNDILRLIHATSLTVTGARCVATLLHEMKRRGRDCRFGVVSMCIGILLLPLSLSAWSVAVTYAYGGVIIFGSIWFLLKKITKLNFFKKKKNQNRFKPTGFGSVRFSFLGQKPVQLGFSWFGSVFSVFCRFWLGFFSSV
jgi:hypothetical protein